MRGFEQVGAIGPVKGMRLAIPVGDVGHERGVEVALAVEDAAADGLARRPRLFGERHLRYVVRQFMAHYHRERFHQALDGQLVQKPADETRPSGKVVCRSRLGGMLNFYLRKAA
jgi:hypothetical protein